MKFVAHNLIQLGIEKSVKAMNFAGEYNLAPLSIAILS